MDSPNNQSYNCSCGKELQSFSAPFLEYSCPAALDKANPFVPGGGSNQDNELLLKDPVMRKRAMVNTLDCAAYESHTMREMAKGSNYGRVSGSYYRAVHLPARMGDVRDTYCRNGGGMPGPMLAPAPRPGGES